MTIQQRRRAFLEEMVQHYGEDTSRRSFSAKTDICMYRGPGGKKCQIGRFISDDKYKKYFEQVGLASDQTEVINEIIGALPIEIQELGVDFLAKVQGVHDDSEYWTSKGLSGRGKLHVEEILKEYC